MPAKKPTMRENISSRPTDSSGRRASDADLGIGPGVAAARKAAAEKIMAREGTTNPSGARPAVLRVAPAKPVKPVAKIIPAKQQAIIRTTTAYKPTPTKKK
jgi:hypothetical protein